VERQWVAQPLPTQAMPGAYLGGLEMHLEQALAMQAL